MIPGFNRFPYLLQLRSNNKVVPGGFMRSGESHTFLSKKLSGDKSQLLLRLFQVFCSWTPLVEMTISDASAKNVRKVVEPGPDGKEGWVTFRRPITGREERIWIPHKLSFEEA